MHNICWDYSWVEADRSLCHIALYYWHYSPLLPITLMVAWQLLLLSSNAKVIQQPCCYSYSKGACGDLHKWLCWEVGVSTIVFVLL